MQPMVRNAGEALGVKALVNVETPGDKQFASLVDVDQIDRMERQLRGDDPKAAPLGFKGLRAPVWPADVLGPIDQAKREQGRILYEDHCEGCHLPAVDDPAGRFWDDKYWPMTEDNKRRYLKLKLIDLAEIGTDPAQAKILTKRRVKLPSDLGLAPCTLCNGNDAKVVKEAKFGPALAAITEKVIDARYDALGITDEATRQAMNCHRLNCLQDESPGYKARPLDGIWATAPFLHDGSVPSLYALLSPVEERPKSFCVGRREFYPVHVGYDSTALFGACDTGLSKFDTTLSGNLNGGHEFANKPEGNGVIGPMLSK